MRPSQACELSSLDIVQKHKTQRLLGTGMKEEFQNRESVGLMVPHDSELQVF